MFYLGRSISLLVFGLIFQLGLDLTTEIFKDLTTLIIHPLTPDDVQYPSIFEHYIVLHVNSYVILRVKKGENYSLKMLFINQVISYNFHISNYISHFLKVLFHSMISVLLVSFKIQFNQHNLVV